MTETATTTAGAKIAAALVKCQAKLTNPIKDRNVDAGRMKYRYATLPQVLDVVRPVLAEHGLAYVQLIEKAHNHLRTVLLHESGESIEATYPLPATAGYQEMGSAITYARRYSLTAMLGIAADDDDDGAAADASAPNERDQLTEAMAKHNLGNVDVIAWCRERKLCGPVTKSTENLSDEAVKQALANVASITKATPPTTNVQPVTPAPAPKVEAAAHVAPTPTEPATVDVEGVHTDLAKLMLRDRITKAEIMHVAVSKGHYPKSTMMTAEQLPASYINQVIAQWDKFKAYLRDNPATLPF